MYRDGRRGYPHFCSVGGNNMLKSDNTGVLGQRKAHHSGVHRARVRKTQQLNIHTKNIFCKERITQEIINATVDFCCM